MFVTSSLSILIILIWYYGAIAAALTAIGSSGGHPIVNALPAHISKGLSELGPKLAGWQIWISASVLMVLLPINLIVDVAYSTKRYITNDNDMAKKLQTRIALAIVDAKKKNYTDIIVFSHSFGTVAAVEALADFQSNIPIHLITTGSPLAITCARSLDLECAVQNILDNQAITYWSDLYSDDDWMCCAPPVPSPPPKFQAYPLKFPMGFLHKLTSKAHMSYFDCNILYELILEIPQRSR